MMLYQFSYIMEDGFSYDLAHFLFTVIVVLQ